MCGIIIDQACLRLFENINRRPYCKKCHEERIQFAQHDKKHNDCYSNLLPGFSSEVVKIPIDFLIVAEAHGGGRVENFRQQLNLETEVAELAEYYLSKPLQKFHQQQMRILLKKLNDKGKTWVFTDLIKCFVWHGKGSPNLKGKDNKSMAIQHCRVYLDKQIKVLQPRKILSLGGTLKKNYFGLKGKIEHARVYEHEIRDHKFTLISSIFPSRNTADSWVETEGWKTILPKLK